MITVSQFSTQTQLQDFAKTAAVTVANKIQDQAYGFFEILDDQNHFHMVENCVHKLALKFKTFVVLGTGGSSLGAQTLTDIKQNPLAPTIFYLNNVDPWSLQNLLSTLNLETTCFLAVSKSGSTSETVMQTLCIIKYLEARGMSIKNHFEIITEDKRSPLDAIAETYMIDPLPHDKTIGGRFSVFSNVGMIPAGLAGLSLKDIINGAKSYITSFLAEPESHSSLQGAAAIYDGIKASKNISVFMPYADRLQKFSAWYEQLWAESLGKDGQGSTPLAALGTVDQHSKLQLFRDGPDDKLYTVIIPNSPPVSEKNTPIDFVPNGYVYTDPNLTYMEDKTLFDLLKAEANATVDSLKNAGRPVRTIHYDRLNETTLGALLSHFMLETIILADIMGVDAFDQPGVEESKRLTRDYMQQLRSA